MDARRHLHAAGAALAQPRLGGRGVHAVRRRPRAQRRRRDADHVRDRRPARPHRVHARRPLGVRRRAPGADRQRRLRPAPERRLRRRPGLHPAAHPPQPAALAPAVADRREPGRVRDDRVARPRPGHLGGARRAAALRVVQADGLGGDGSRGQARGDPRRRRPPAALARGGGGDPRRHPRARRRHARRAAPALRDRRARRLEPARRDLRLPPRGRPAPACERAGDRRRADRERLRPALPHRRDRRRPLGQGRDVPDLLVLARLGAGRDRRAAARPRPDGAAAAQRVPARALRRGARRRAPAATSATSRRRSRTSR